MKAEAHVAWLKTVVAAILAGEFYLYFCPFLEMTVCQVSCKDAAAEG